jgi:hypothetical protein
MLFLVIMVLFARTLPEPPPIAEMALFNGAELKNYFVFVGFGVLLNMAWALFVLLPPLKATPGHLAAGIRLVGGDGGNAPLAGIAARAATVAFCWAVISIPGPLFILVLWALIIWLFAIPNETLMTLEQLMIHLGIVGPAQTAIRAVPFIFLFTGLWFVIGRYVTGYRPGTVLDEGSDTLFVRRSWSGLGD